MGWGNASGARSRRRSPLWRRREPLPQAPQTLGSCQELRCARRNSRGRCCTGAAWKTGFRQTTASGRSQPRRIGGIQNPASGGRPGWGMPVGPQMRVCLEDDAPPGRPWCKSVHAGFDSILAVGASGSGAEAGNRNLISAAWKDHVLPSSVHSSFCLPQYLQPRPLRVCLRACGCCEERSRCGGAKRRSRFLCCRRIVGRSRLRCGGGHS